MGGDKSGKSGAFLFSNGIPDFYNVQSFLKYGNTNESEYMKIHTFELRKKE